jgi:peroxiredoxin family protein
MDGKSGAAVKSASVMKLERIPMKKNINKNRKSWWSRFIERLAEINKDVKSGGCGG